MDGHDSLLLKLGVDINSALGLWTSWVTAIARYPTLESILSGDPKDTSAMVKTLEYILETLPTRHCALVHAYNDDNIEPIELFSTCANLPEELGLPERAFEIGNELAQKVTSKRFRAKVVDIEKQLSEKEQGRCQESKRLKACHSYLMRVGEDAIVGKVELTTLMEAMEELGISFDSSGLDVNEAK